MATRIDQKAVVITSVIVDAVDCANCGVVFGLSQDYIKERQRDGRDFYCPNGHSLTYGVGEIGKLKEQLEQEKQRTESFREWANHNEVALVEERKAHAVTKGQLTKTRKRVQNGVCPECNRHFTNLELHMHTKHTKYGEGS